MATYTNEQCCYYNMNNSADTLNFISLAFFVLLPARDAVINLKYRSQKYKMLNGWMSSTRLLPTKILSLRVIINEWCADGSRAYRRIQCFTYLLLLHSIYNKYSIVTIAPANIITENGLAAYLGARLSNYAPAPRKYRK